MPFFVELLAAHHAVEKRRFIVDSLHHLALGYPADLFPTPFQLEGLLAQAAEVDAASLPQSMLDGDSFGELPEGTNASRPMPRAVVRLIAEHGDWATQNGRQIINANQSELLRGWRLPPEQRVEATSRSLPSPDPLPRGRGRASNDATSAHPKTPTQNLRQTPLMAAEVFDLSAFSSWRAP